MHGVEVYVGKFFLLLMYMSWMEIMLDDLDSNYTQTNYLLLMFTLEL